MVIVEEPHVWGDTAAAEIRAADVKDVVHISTPGVAPNGHIDPFAVTGLLVAMSTGEQLVLRGPVSSRLLEGMQQAQVILQGFYPELHVVPIEAEVRTEPDVRSSALRERAAFYTAGVDSTSLVLSRLDQLDALITIPSFFAERGWVVNGREFRDGLRQGAQAIGLPLIEVATNLRQFIQPFIQWGPAHGGVLGAIALAMTERFADVRMASSHEPNSDIPLGSHPLLDHLWSSHELEFGQLGRDEQRIDKMRLIATRPDVAKWLQVCWDVDRTNYNCGRCEKCVRTALDFRVVGALGICPSLPDPNLLKEAFKVTKVPLILLFAENRIPIAEERGDASLAASMRVHVGISKARNGAVKIVKSAVPRAERIRRRSTQ